MALPMRTAEEYHADEHFGPIEDCPHCRIARAKCRRKIRFADWGEADEWVTDYHESREYAKPWMYRYRCRWCDGFHMATIRSRERVARDRVEKQRRKWLIRRRQGEA